MRRRSRQFIVAGLALALGSSAGAQELSAASEATADSSAAPASSEGCLDLQVAVQVAMRSTPEVHLGMAERDGFLASAHEARSAGRPRLTLTARTGIGDGVQADNQLDNRVGINASQLLFDFGASGATRNAADARVEGAEGQLAAAQDELGQRVATIYLELARREERLAVLREQRNDYLLQVEGAERRFSRLLVRQSDMSMLRAELALVEATLAREELEIANLREMLGAVLSRPVACIATAGITPWLARRWMDSSEERMTRARDHSGALIAARSEADAAGYDYRAARRSQLPAVYAAANVAEEYDRASNGWRRFNRVGLDFRLPLFSGGEMRARADAAQARIAGAQARLEREERDLTIRLNTALNQVSWLEGIRNHQAAALDGLATRSAAIQREYDAGIATLTTLTEARRDHLKARLDEIDMRFQMIGQQVQVITLTGMLEE